MELMKSYDAMDDSQRKAVCWMWYNLFDSCRGGILADSVANNLIQVTQFLHGLCLPRLVFKCLLIVPTQSIDLWVSALLQLAPRLRVAEFVGPQRNRRLEQVLQLGGVVVTSYGIAVSDLVPRMGTHEDSVGDEANVWDVIVFDSAERLKDTTSKTNAALSRLQANINLLLTSHPLLTHPRDLYSLFDFACEADIFGSYDLFKDRFELPITRSSHKRADDMDRQLAAVARIQMADLIDSQYWQNWSELFTPGGSKRQEVMPAFIATPTPFKDRTNTYASNHDISSTPSFSKSKSAVSTKKKTQTPSTATKKTTTKKKATKNKSLFPEVIDLVDSDTESPMCLDELEKSIATLSFESALSSSSGPQIGKNKSALVESSARNLLSTPTNAKSGSSSVVDLSTPPQPARRTPIRNAFYSGSPHKTPVQSIHGEPGGSNLGSEFSPRSSAPGSPISPAVIQARQRLSFGRISLLDEGETNEIDVDDEDAMMNTPHKSAGSALSRGVTPINGKDMKKSIVSKEWTSTEAFLKRRESFALELFGELNVVIFGGKLPRLPLVWRKMKNCAGIYHFKDSSITLSKSLLTNSKRLTSTLAHEMAHAAAHLIDESPHDGHGAVWQKWARIGRARYPSVITGSVYHDYCSQNLHPDGEDA